MIETLAGWGSEDPDTVVLLTHELVTNAVLKGGEPIVLRLERQGAGAAPARRWGRQPAGQGKVVWCEVEQ